MVITFGKAVFTCPSTGKDVVLHKDCAGPNPCKHFRHWGQKGARPYVSCDVEVAKPQEAPKAEPPL